MKGHKVTDSRRCRTVGIACDSLKQLLIKGSRKLNIETVSVVALEDGTVVDDDEYFQSLPGQTVFVFYRNGEQVTTGVDIIIETLRRVNSMYLSTGDVAKQYLLEKTQELSTLLEKSMEGDQKLSNTREDDPEWFGDLETNAKTKEEFMFRKSQDRVRGYFYKFQEDIRKSELFLKNGKARKELNDCLLFFKNHLNTDNYFGCFFDRRCSGKSYDDVDSWKKKRSLDNLVVSLKRIKSDDSDGLRKNYDKSSYCNEEGTFACQGKWKLNSCEYNSKHVINPYANRESRIIFSTWNLDHRIEKTRTILPALLKTVENRSPSQMVNHQYFYQLLFTNLNLKLVHIVCHDKSIHDVGCDTRFLYI